MTPSASFPPFPDDLRVAPLVAISLRKLLESPSSLEHEHLFNAAKSLGFFYLDMRQTIVGEELLEEGNSLFDIMTELFSLPLDELQKYNFGAQNVYFGYRPKVKDLSARNEHYNTSKDDMLCISDPLPKPDVVVNHYEGLKTYIEVNHAIMTTILQSLATSLQLPVDTFTSLHRLYAPSGCHVRFISTPALTKPPKPGETLGREHTDFGSLTILLNRLGGLQVQLPNSDDWVYVRPMLGCAIVNLGDAMVKFTGGVLRSNLHRVVAPPGDQWKFGRQSLVYFLRPENDVVLRRLKGGLIDELGEGEHDGVTSKEWLYGRHILRNAGTEARTVKAS